MMMMMIALSCSMRLENIEPSQGLAVEASLMFLQRLISLVDVLIFASSLNFKKSKQRRTCLLEES